MTGAKEDITRAVARAGPDVSLRRIEEWGEAGASIKAPVSVTETPRASPRRSSARDLVSQTTGLTALTGAIKITKDATSESNLIMQIESVFLIIKVKLVIQMSDVRYQMSVRTQMLSDI